MTVSSRFATAARRTSLIMMLGLLSFGTVSRGQTTMDSNPGGPVIPSHVDDHDDGFDWGLLGLLGLLGLAGLRRRTDHVHVERNRV